MVEVTVRVPENIKDIISETSETIYVEALKEVARKRTSNIQRRLKQLRCKNSAYEKKYSKSYAEFSQNIPDTMKAHDDWIEWSYLVKVADELTYKVEKVKLLLGK
ncbi:MAG: hypothetical protein U9R02_01025 [Thermodesulfobacteriota bacterium]|nr:hypothetical protein [Thermodesulfobacteriota bacterium]